MQAQQPAKVESSKENPASWADISSEEDEPEPYVEEPVAKPVVPQEANRPVEVPAYSVPEGEGFYGGEEESYGRGRYRPRRGRGYGRRSDRGGRGRGRYSHEGGGQYEDRPRRSIAEKIAMSIEALQKATPPVVLKLIRAPQLTKGEIAKIFSLSEDEFDVNDTGSAQDGDMRYFIKLSKIDSAVRVFKDFPNNKVIKGFEVMLFYDPPENDYNESRGSRGRGRGRGRYRGRGGYDGGFEETGSQQPPAEMPHFFRSTAKKEDPTAIKGKDEKTDTKPQQDIKPSEDTKHETDAKIQAAPGKNEGLEFSHDAPAEPQPWYDEAEEYRRGRSQRGGGRYRRGERGFRRSSYRSRGRYQPRGGYQQDYESYEEQPYEQLPPQQEYAAAGAGAAEVYYEGSEEQPEVGTGGGVRYVAKSAKKYGNQQDEPKSYAAPKKDIEPPKPAPKAAAVPRPTNNRFAAFLDQ